MSSKNILSSLENVIQKFEEKNFIEKKSNRDRGVTYTPQPIAHFMVLNIFKIFFDDIPKISKIFKGNFNFSSLKQLIKRNGNIRGAFWNKINCIKILDPSCGTGRFLIAIAKILFNFYKAFESEYTDYEIKKNIIQNHIFGIEIDKASYNISKLRLVKWLYTDNFSLLNESISNNPLPGEIEDFLNKVDLNFNLFNLDYLLDYEAEDIDIIIGNPPYVENKKILEKEFKKNLKREFESAYKLFDLSVVFIEKSLKLLKNRVGCLSFITTNKFLSADYGVKIREILLRNTEIKEIINISSLPIFKSTAAYPIILFIKKEKNRSNLISIKKFDAIKDINSGIYMKIIEFAQSSIYKFPSLVIPLSENIELIEELYSKFSVISENFKDLKIIYRPYGFIEWAKNSKYVKQNISSAKDLLLLGTGNVGRYFIDFNKKIKIAQKRYQRPYYAYNVVFKEIWKDLSNEKLIFREIAKDLSFVYDPGVFTNLTGLYFLRVPSLDTNQLFSLLAILNSDLINKLFKSLYGTLHMSGGYLRINGSFIKRIPIPEFLPESLSRISKSIHFLTQLKHEILHKSVFNSGDIININFLEKILAHLHLLSDSIVNQLYHISQKDSNIERILEISENIPEIEFKFINTYYTHEQFKTYSREELNANYEKIKNWYLEIYHEI
ncbi:MAG: Eco57I restriction-modification methylase domain-containing protein [Candidatus Lokiarchaeota archaeon]|nr:Eco57I restriction-modification methylase domain-containing protein [Candidatus Lokiarchaeota archaeon]